ncbi:hypothetical protein IRZ71_20635 [Flavobacterium sp. ANB]|uniref:hypothetical protein n=1 Tax=unclassified Flavobacterium TaxID=196869 RepID=UPI0012B8ACAF|nr:MULTISPECIES: hypothetical protein [unclassified Flavobacterium]MBF4518769.1 hypothetical protein [Flavobacterium sp. ANB]MTD71518.1 hypothetical protein [Flavobacterium sp. LC2016-13]
MKKLSLKNVESMLSRNEMKMINGGYSSGGKTKKKCCWNGTTNCSICIEGGTSCVDGATLTDC